MGGSPTLSPKKWRAAALTWGGTLCREVHRGPAAGDSAVAGGVGRSSLMNWTPRSSKYWVSSIPNSLGYGAASPSWCPIAHGRRSRALQKCDLAQFKDLIVTSQVYSESLVPPYPGTVWADPNNGFVEIDPVVSCQTL